MMKKLFFIVISVFYYINISNGYNVDALSDSLYKGTKDNLNKSQIVKTFCNNVNKYNDSEYNSKESLFLKILCNNLGIHTDYKYKSSTDLGLKTNHLKDYKNLFKTAKNNTKKGIYAKCQITGGYTTDPESLNNVNFACVTSSIFNKLSNDYLNVATYFAYGGFSGKDGLKKFEGDFFRGSNCKDSFLVSDDANKKQCQHPKTYKYLKELNSGLNKGIKKLSFLNITPDNIYDKVSGKGGSNHFLNAKDKLYNELYFYGLFSEYYASMIELDPTRLSLKTDNMNGIGQIELGNQQEVRGARQDITLSHSSIKKSFSVLKDVYWTFPLHVGYMTVKEDIGPLMKSLAKIYTPIDQLRTKLKNVQDKDKK